MNNLKNLRNANNLSQYQVAKVINKTTSAYGYYEVGRNDPDIETLIKLADYFNVSLDYLCGRQWNNKVGYIPEDRINAVNALINLNELNFGKAEAYIFGKLETQENENITKGIK